MSGSNQKLKLGETSSRFLGSLPPDEVGVSQQVIYQFVRWFGRERPLDDLTANEIANYAQRISSSDTDYQRKLDLVRAFLNYARKTGWIKKNMAMHLKAKKGKTKLAASHKQDTPTTVSLTKQGYNEIKKELADLKSKRPLIINEIRRAAEDKDFRENAPLDAARERLSHLEGRIIELEETLKVATVLNDKVEVTHKVGTGDSVVLLELASGEEVHYTIVSPKEVAPTSGKISIASPIGRAIIGRGCGDTIEIEVPAGRLRYQSKQVK